MADQPRPMTFEASPDTRLLRAKLKSIEIGQSVTYAELSQVISRPVSGSSVPLRSALRGLLHDEQRVFGVIRGVGVKRLADPEIVEASDSDVDSIRRKAKKAARKLTAIQDYAQLDPAHQLAHTARLSIVGAIASMTTDKAIKKIEAVSSGRASELPIAETLRAFTS
jgi:hypothetical protein